MALQSLRKGATALATRSAFRYLVPQAYQQLQQGLAPAMRSPAVMAATEPKFSLWNLRMSSSAREVGRDASDGLISVLRSELDHERKTYKQPKVLSKGPPSPWTLTDKQGHADVILRRSYGKEDIAVTCVYQLDQSGERNRDDYDLDRDEDDENRDPEDDSEINEDCLTMSITINKGDVQPTLEISATSYGTGNNVTIEHVYYWETKESKEVVYDGPNFLKLDVELQNQFEKYIKERGVNKDFTGYVMSLMVDKEQREYMRWLQKVEGFLKL